MSDLSPVLSACLERWEEGARETTARRLFHGRGHCYPGFEDLTVDRFGTVLLIGCFAETADRAMRLAKTLAAALPGVSGICVQHRQGRGTRTEVAVGTVPEEVVVQEAGLSYLVMPLRNQNVGLFLDMGPTRAWIRDHAAGKRVLNLFAFTCAFSVAAAAGGAAGVVNNDMSRAALDWGRRNHELNGHDQRHIKMVAHNLFKSWSKIRQLGPFDMVVIDPPTNQRGSFNAEKQYGQVLKRLPDLLTERADIVACLNSPFLGSEFLTGQMARWCPDARFQAFMPVSPDFPDRFEDRGLKIARYR